MDVGRLPRLLDAGPDDARRSASGELWSMGARGTSRRSPLDADNSRTTPERALLGVVILAVFLGLSGAFSSGGNAPLTGQLSSAPSGVLSGDVLGDELSDIIREDGGEVSDLRCPETPSVRQGVVTLCHGTISGAAWAVAVFFEDGQGRYTALPM